MLLRWFEITFPWHDVYRAQARCIRQTATAVEGDPTAERDNEEEAYKEDGDDDDDNRADQRKERRRFCPCAFSEAATVLLGKKTLPIYQLINKATRHRSIYQRPHGQHQTPNRHYNSFGGINSDHEDLVAVRLPQRGKAKHTKKSEKNENQYVGRTNPTDGSGQPRHLRYNDRSDNSSNQNHDDNDGRVNNDCENTGNSIDFGRSRSKSILATFSAPLWLLLGDLQIKKKTFSC